MSAIRGSDPDFRICQASFNDLIEVQLEAEERGWATRWTSVEALRSQVKEADVIFQTLMREERKGVVRSYRCFLLFSAVDSEISGGLATIDVHPEKFDNWRQLDRDPDVRKAFSRIFALAAGGISMISKG